MDFRVSEMATGDARQGRNKSFKTSRKNFSNPLANMAGLTES
jgi:hypothetical protein